MLITTSEINFEGNKKSYQKYSELDLSTIDILKEQQIEFLEIFDSEEINMNLYSMSDDNSDVLCLKQKVVKICASLYITMEIES